MNGYLEAFNSQDPFTCAISRSQASLLGLVQAAWCLSRRILPGTPGWSAPAQPERRQPSPFYLPAESRAWFIPAVQVTRHAGLDLPSASGSFTHLILSDAPLPASPGLEAPGLETLRLFPIAAE